MMRTGRTLQSNMRLWESVVLLGTLGLLLLTACHTTAGLGQDMQSVGRNIERNANQNNR